MMSGHEAPHGETSDDAQERPFGSRSGRDDERLPPGVGALQGAAREAIEATRALLDAAEALVDDPETVERMTSVVRAATGAAARAAEAGRAGTRNHDGDDDDGEDGVQRIPVV